LSADRRADGGNRTGIGNRVGNGLLALELAAAALAAWLVARFVPLPADDAFRGTLAALPLLLAGFHALGRFCAAGGGRRLPAAGTAAELAATGGLVLLVLGRGQLGLPHADEALAAALLLVLAARTARQLAAARPLLGGALPDRPSALFFFLPLAVYLAILPWSAGHHQPDGDEPFYLLVTHSLASDLDADLTNNYAQADWRHFMDRPIHPQPGDPVGARGERYSRHNALLPILLTPAYRLFGKLGALATMAALAAALAWMTLRLARHYARAFPGEALAAYGLVAFASPLLLYSFQVWVEVPAALLAAVALDRALALPTAGDRRAWGWRGWLGFGLPVLLLPLLKIRLMLLAASLLAIAWWRSGRRGRPVWVMTALLAAVGGGMLLYNQHVYANPLKIHAWQELDLHQYSPAAYALGFSGLLYDAAFGLFACAPIWLLLLPATVMALRGGSHGGADGSPPGSGRAALGHLAVLTAPYLLAVIPRSEWYGGWSPPFRYALVALPLLGVALVPLLAECRRRDLPGARVLAAGLAALTLALFLVWVVVPGWTFNFADGRTYLLDGLADRLGADVARFFPSSIRPRPATWLWPVATLLLVPLLWWLPKGGRRRGGAAAGAGIAATLLLAAAIPIAAARLPTRTIELEDPQVGKSGGYPFPERWTIERTRFRGAWTLRTGERVTAPVVGGGRRVRIVLTAQPIRNQPQPFEIVVAAGDLELASWTPQRDREWRQTALGPFAWPAGAPLVISARGPRAPWPPNGVLLDRVDLEWIP
jgi:hypothetical protein